MGVNPKIGGKPPKMDGKYNNIMVKTLLKFMMWVKNPIFGLTPISQSPT